MIAITLSGPVCESHSLLCVNDTQALEVARYLDEIEQSAKQITDLVMERNEMTCAISRALKNKALQRVQMTEHQITAFKKFAENSHAALVRISKLLDDVRAFETIETLKREMLDPQTDYNTVIKGLKKQYKKQKKAVIHLDHYIQESKKMLRYIVD